MHAYNINYTISENTWEIIEFLFSSQNYIIIIYEIVKLFWFNKNKMV